VNSSNLFTTVQCSRKCEEKNLSQRHESKIIFSEQGPDFTKKIYLKGGQKCLKMTHMQGKPERRTPYTVPNLTEPTIIFIPDDFGAKSLYYRWGKKKYIRFTSPIKR